MLPVDGHDDAWERLAAAFAATAACEDTASAVQVVADTCVRLLQADRVTINQVEPERGLIRILVHAGKLGDDEERLPPDETYALDAFGGLDHTSPSARPWRTHVGAVDAHDHERTLLGRMGRFAAVAVPVHSDGRVWGEVYATRFAQQPFTDLDAHHLGLLGAHLGAVLTVLQRGDRRTAHAQVDALTGLVRRDAAERLVAAQRDGVVLAAFDLDGLKTVNDEFGHAAGDRLLCEVADALSAAVADLPGSLVARVGGDEFVAVVPGLDVDAVHAACVAARVAVAEVLPDAGLSCGVAASTDLSGPMGSGRPLFRLADATLYRAKRARATEPLRAWHATGVDYHPDVDGGAAPDTPSWQEQLARLRGPVDVFARSVNAAAWFVSHAPAGQGAVITRDRLVLRDRREEHEADIALLGAVYDLEHLPWTVDALRGRSHFARINDPDVHPAEQLFLAELGYTGNLMAGLTQPDGDGWLVEIYCDPVTAQVDRMGDSLLHLVRRALGVPVG